MAGLRLVCMAWIAWIPAVLPAQEAVLSKVQSQGGRVMKLAQNDERLEVAYHLSDREIVDDNLQPLAELQNVYLINLRGTKITDAGLAHLAGLKSLARLHLERTAITDAGLVHLAGLENLEYLNLYETKVTDAGLGTLGNLKKLKKLYLWQTGVTLEGVKAFQQQHPTVQVVSGLSEPVAPMPEEKNPEEKSEEKKPEEKPAN